MTLSSQTVIPTRGAVVRARFNPDVGARVLLTLLTRSGDPVPFGATVSNLNSPLTMPASSATVARFIWPAWRRAGSCG